ncbi:hypothetical protein O181_057594 [Austropuccinia psidii MF-1]|uniref:Reverse transcriptase domain-containing protein n=1 Tax=Austropuccinia psidii MF-1 TaxID=1389203 RepID=A0A9Q3EAU8_9BASI|nr:hypothetical protein [Austropuccinia psidii MF-1]
MGIYEYTRMPFGIKNAPAHFQRMMDTIFQGEILEGSMVVYIDDIIIYSQTWEDHMQYIDRALSKCTPINLNHIKGFAHITSSLHKLCSKDGVFEITKERRDANERIKNELKNAPVLIFPDFELPFKLYIDAACSQGLGAALNQRQIVEGEPREGVICYISRQLKDSEARYGATLTECLCLVWALEKIYYYLEGAVFEVYTDCTALKSLLNMKTTNIHMLRWPIAIQEYKGKMTIIYKEGKSHTNSDGPSRLPLGNVKRTPAYDPEVEAKILIHFMEIDRKKNFRFSEWTPEHGTPESGNCHNHGNYPPGPHMASQCHINLMAIWPYPSSLVKLALSSFLTFYGHFTPRASLAP